MLPIGIVVATFGYTLTFYGVKLWSGAPVTLAYALGFAKTNTAGGSATDTVGTPAAAAAAPGAGGGRIAPKTPKRPKAKQGRRIGGKAPAPVVAPPP